jgi:DNA-binding NarL/FixJ family response regulator
MRNEESARTAHRDDRQSKTSSDSVRIYIVSDVRVYREALKNCLENSHGIVVVGAGGVTEKTLLEVTFTKAQLVLVDFAPLGSLTLAKVAVEGPTRPKVIAVGIAESDEQVLACAEAGLSGYVPYGASVEDLQRVMYEAMENKFVCSPRITALLVRKIAQLSTASVMAPNAPASRLTLRQKQIAVLLGEGLTNKEIARNLSICSATVRNHVHVIFEKLKVRRRAEAVAVLYVNGSGLTPPGDASQMAINGTSAGSAACAGSKEAHQRRND